jgi:hypothetical protein
MQRAESVAGSTMIVVFDGNAESLTTFAAETNLDLKRTVLLPEPAMEVGRRYAALPCPRLFVLDGGGIVRYVNDHADDQPQTASSATLVSKAAAALSGLSAGDSGKYGPVPVLPIKTLSAKEPNHLVHDFGEIDRVLKPRIEQVILLRNDTKSTIAIERLVPTCGCAAVLLSQSVQPNANVLAPGQTAEIKVSMDLRGLRPGKITKQVWIYSKGTPGADAILDLTLKLPPTVEFAEPKVDIGLVASGTARTVTVMASVDNRLLSGGWPTLVCSHPDVQISPGTLKAYEGGPWRKRTYTITVPPGARIGPLAGTIAFASGGPNPLGKDAEDTPFLGGASVTLGGEVKGPISASPSAVVIGALEAGIETNKTIIISGDSPQALEGLTIANAGVHLLTHLGPVELEPTAINPRAASLKLIVRLLKTRPLGALETDVTVTTPKGARLVVPIIVFTPAN